MEKITQFFTSYNYSGVIGITRNFYNAAIKCMSKDSEWNLDSVYINNEMKKAIITDGKRLLLIDVCQSEIKEGFYRPVKSGKDYFLIPLDRTRNFFGHKKVIPDNNLYDDIILNQSFYNIGESKQHLKEKRTIDNSIFICKLISATKCFFNLHYIETLSYLGLFNVKFKDNKSSIIFYNDGWQYIVMPLIRLGNGES